MLKVYRLERKGIEQSIWLIMVAIIALIVVLILMTMFGSTMERTGVESQKTLNATGNTITCTLACKTCCIERIELDCSNDPSLPDGCNCLDMTPGEPGC